MQSVIFYSPLLDSGSRRCDRRGLTEQSKAKWREGGAREEIKK